MLEGDFVTIRGTQVGFVNPSLRDYLTGYLAGENLLLEIARGAHQSDWAQAVWKFGTKLSLSEATLRTFALSFIEAAQRFTEEPIWTVVRGRYGPARHAKGLSSTNRIELLIEWWTTDAGRTILGHLARPRAFARRRTGFVAGRQRNRRTDCRAEDGDYFDDFPGASDVADHLEVAAVAMLESAMTSDELEKISDATEEWRSSSDRSALPRPRRSRQVRNRERRHDRRGHGFGVAPQGAHRHDPETLKRVDLVSQSIPKAVEKVMDRITKLEEETDVSNSPSF
ncbi:hypothetical protein [Bradyrhizobium sp. SSUT77]|uniref:hypothetical protein n=1 Tax=Bradyrhizobium sp. SSUT77 TaxID=3040603 RepID=UPI0024494A9E|nr:hypothetical protein [Bradyrhizobium sp. SSUT77]MDH2349030.1 hypothetical protein [Bradyrhizobium sp. SSUT77]